VRRSEDCDARAFAAAAVEEERCATCVCARRVEAHLAEEGRPLLVSVEVPSHSAPQVAPVAPFALERRPVLLEVMLPSSCFLRRICHFRPISLITKGCVFSGVVHCRLIWCNTKCPNADFAGKQARHSSQRVHALRLAKVDELGRMCARLNNKRTLLPRRGVVVGEAAKHRHRVEGVWS
jgi:hypothetical protein